MRERGKSLREDKATSIRARPQGSSSSRRISTSGRDSAALAIALELTLALTLALDIDTVPHGTHCWSGRQQIPA
jgi:hypothetical protein